MITPEEIKKAAIDEVAQEISEARHRLEKAERSLRSLNNKELDISFLQFLSISTLDRLYLERGGVPHNERNADWEDSFARDIYIWELQNK